MKAYRFSTSWARIDPSGDGTWNEAGLSYYDKVVDLCLQYGIVPYLTLYHWELPQALQDRGGWLSRETAEAFGRYAGKVAAHFRNRVKHYFTLNEPQCTTSLGYNIYNGHAVRAAGSGYEFVPKYPGFPRTALKWPVTPEVLDWGVRYLQERYGLPGYITENGLSCNDRVYLGGKVHDGERIDFLARYLNCLSRAVESGADIRGYFHWALTDNLEWHSGYGDRFGLIYVDFPTLTRIPKDSFYWYQRVIRSGDPESR